MVLFNTHIGEAEMIEHNNIDIKHKCFFFFKIYTAVKIKSDDYILFCQCKKCVSWGRI